MKQLILCLIPLLCACSLPKKICSTEVLTVTKVGGCHSDRYGLGSCGAILSDGSYTHLTAPVEGLKVNRCSINGDQISYRIAQ